MRPALRHALLLAALALACEKPSERKPARAPRPLPPSAALAKATEELWSEQMRHSPQLATYFGDRSRDTELDDLSDKEWRRHVDALFALRVKLDSLDRAALGPSERVTLDAMRETLEARIAAANACVPWTWQVDPLDGPAIRLVQLPIHHTIDTPQDAHSLATRYRAAGAQLDGHRAALRAGLEKGYVPPEPVVARLIASLDGILAVPAAESPMAKAKLPDAEPGWSMEEVVRVRTLLVKAVEEGAYPALTAYRDFLKREVLPKARTEKMGADGLPGGSACYAAMVRRETGTSRTPKELHELGLAQVAAIEAEMDALAKGAGAKDRGAYVDALNASPAQRFESREAIVAHNEAWLAKARVAAAKAFRDFPETPLEVRPVEPWRERDAPSSYDQAPADHSRPAIYWVNTVDLPDQRRYDMASLAAHEAIPGHHFQIALAQENPTLPRFQRDLPPNAYVEGWALYAERLADELGLYTPDERFGMLEAQRHRAVRLVVDTGLHALGWTREQAVLYQMKHGGSTRAGAERAIDRYLTWPGQALGYMVGQLEIQAMRADARKRLGPKFDLAEFHERVLANGGVPLSVVRREIDAWQ